MSKFQAERAKDIRDRMSRCFEKHVITQDLNQGVFRSWYCAKPEDCFHWFRVTTWPGYLAVTGDLGDVVFSRCQDMIPWARSSIRDPNYMASKVVAGNVREFSLEDLREWLEEERDELYKDGGDSIAAEIQNLLEDDELSIADVYATGIFDEVPRCEVLTREFLRIIEALRWFFEKTKETE